MATERRAVIVMFAFAVAAAGCGGANSCRPGTALVGVTLTGAAAIADTLDVEIAVAGSTHDTMLAHTPGSDAGSIEVQFPSGYPAGSSVTVTVVALLGQEVLGSATQTLALPSGCASISLSVTADGSDLAADGDLASASDMARAGDLASASDMASAPQPDLASARDMASAPQSDMACKTTIENCFNGVDDNCDGLVDCADPQCTGGASPVAECIPDPGSAVAGTLTSSFCPTGHPTSTQLYASLRPGICATGSCACSDGLSGTPTCSASLVDKGGSAASCLLTNSTVVFSGNNDNGCISFSALSATGYYALSAALDAACFAPSGGSATKVSPSWGETDVLCGGFAVGGGCGSGQICVPVAPNHCVVETGSQVACSVAGYAVQRTTQYFSGYDDSGRSCSCSCSPGGSCAVDFYSNGTCTSTANKVATGCTNGWSAYTSAQISAPSSAGCAPGATQSGATSTSGFERTVCCTN